MKSEYRKLVSALRKAGWDVRHMPSTHIRVTPPPEIWHNLTTTRRFVILESSPGDRRALKNKMAELRRMGWTG